jgi:hypothetical protein
VRELAAKSAHYDRAWRAAAIAGAETYMKEYRVLADNATTQLREARKEQLAEQRKVIDDLGGLAYDASSPDDLSNFVREVAQKQGTKAAVQLAQSFRADPADPSKFLFGDPEKAVLARYVAKATQAKEQAQMQHWDMTEEDAAARLELAKRRTASLEAKRNADIAAKQHGLPASSTPSTFEPSGPGVKKVMFNLQGGVTADEMRQVNEDIARDSGRPVAAASGNVGYGAEYAKLDPAKQSVVDWYATMQLGGDNTWRVGLGRTKGGSALIQAVDERVPAMASELNLTAADIGTNKAVRVATQAGLNQITKDITTLKPYVDMLDQNSDILKTLSTKAIATNSALANKPINWLRQNATDNPDVAEYLAQVEIVKNEATRVISNPRLVGQMTDTARQEIESIINGSMPLNATARVLDRIKNDGERRINTMLDQQKGLQGKLKEMFPGGASATPSAPTAAPAVAAPAGNFQVGKVYTDAKGNKARFTANGWEEVK